MKTLAKLLKLSLLFLLCGLMVFGTVCCSKDTTSSGSVLYGNDEDEEFDDDDDSVTVTKKNAVGGGSTAATYNDNLKRSYTIDEKGKQNFLDSVPKSLSGQEVTILVWWPAFEFETKKMENFTKKTGIKVKFVYASSDNYMQKLSALKAQDNSPDIACITVGNYPSAIMQKYFKPLSAGKLKYDKSVYDLDSMNLLKWNNEYYGAIYKGTTHITMGLLMYNADLFSKYGVTDPHTLWQQNKWNWDTFVKTGQEIQSKSGVRALTAEYQGYRLAQTCGQDAISFSNGKLVNNLSNSTYRNAYKWLNDLGLDGQYKIVDFGLNRNGFMDGKSAMMVEETWALQTGERYEKLPFTLGYAPLPCQTTKTIVPCDAQLWGFPVGSKHTEAAAYVLEYWMNPKFDEAGYNLWTNDSVASFCDWLWEQPKVFKVCEGIINYGGDYKWTTFQYECASSGKANVDSVMDKWSNVIDGNLKKIYSEFGS